MRAQGILYSACIRSSLSKACLAQHRSSLCKPGRLQKPWSFGSTCSTHRDSLCEVLPASLSRTKCTCLSRRGAWECSIHGREHGLGCRVTSRSPSISWVSSSAPQSQIGLSWLPSPPFTHWLALKQLTWMSFYFKLYFIFVNRGKRWNWGLGGSDFQFSHFVI